MAKITWIKEFGKRVYLTFKLWRMVLISIVFLSIVLGTNLLFFLPSAMRWALALVYVLLAEVMVFSIVRLITGSAGQIISSVFYNRKHKPEKRYFPEVKQIAKKMSMEYDKPILITENPSIKSPFTNLFTRNIMFPASWIRKFHRTENDAIIGHELAHIKYRLKFIVELLLVTFVTWGFALLLATITWSLGIYVIAELAFMMIILSYILWRNELRADWEGPACNATTPEALIAVFEYLKAECKRDDGSETHPPLQARIKRLMRLLDSDRQHQDD